MKRTKWIAILLAVSLCLPLVASAISARAAGEIEYLGTLEGERTPPDSDDDITIGEDLSIQDLLDEYLHMDVSVTPVLREHYTGIKALTGSQESVSGGAISGSAVGAVTGSALTVSTSSITVSVADTVVELVEDGFIPYEVQWRVGSYFAEKSQNVNVTVDNLKPGTEYVVVAQIHYTNPQTLVSDWLNLSMVVTTEGLPPEPTPEPIPTVVPTPTPTPVPTPATVTVTRPVLKKVCCVGNTISAKWLCDAGSYEYRILDTHGAVVKSGYSMGPYFYAYNVKKQSKLGIQVRGRVWDSESDTYSYSKWSKKKWVIKQPLVKSKKIKKKSIKVKWNKITGAKKYTVYIRKHAVYKWSKVKTTKKRTCVIKKYKGKRLKPKKKNYDVKIVAIGRGNGHKIVSDKSRYRKMHS